MTEYMRSYVVGVCIPTLNASDVLLRALESLSDISSRHSLLVVLSDGGSTDNTVSIFNSFFAIPRQNVSSHVIIESGASHGRSISTGIDYLLRSNCLLLNWLNADDALTSKSSSLVDYALANFTHTPTVYYGYSSLIKSNGSVVSLKPPETVSFDIMAIQGKPLISQPACLITRNALILAGSVNYLDWNYAIDHELWLRFLSNHVSFVFCDIHVCQERRSYSGKSQLSITAHTKQKLISSYSSMLPSPIDSSVSLVNSYIQAFCYSADSACIGQSTSFFIRSICLVLAGYQSASGVRRIFPFIIYYSFFRDLSWGSYYLLSSALRVCR